MITQIAQRLREAEPVTLATVLKVVGSTPQVVGCKALIEPDGRIAGTLGGGMLEAEAQRRGAALCREGGIVVFDFSMDAAYSRDAGPICGGTMWIMLDARGTALLPAYTAARDAFVARRAGVLVTSLDPATPPLWFDADAVDTLEEDARFAAIRHALTREAPVYVEDPAPVFVEPFFPHPRLLVVGGGHVGQAVAAHAQAVGFDVTVIDDRPEFTQPDRFVPGIATHHGVVHDMVRGFHIDPSTYIVLVSKGHKADAEALEACIDSPAAYIGMIGSKRKVWEIRTDFLARRLATEERWARIHAPIGIDIGAVTVPEIALSIVAQLVAVRRASLAPSSAMVGTRG